MKLTGNEIKTLDPRLGLVNYLEELHVDENKLKGIEPKVFSADKFRELATLNLRANEMALLPTDFGAYLKKLEYLDLGSNRLIQIPEALFQGPCKDTLQVLLLGDINSRSKKRTRLGNSSINGQ